MSNKQDKKPKEPEPIQWRLIIPDHIHDFENLDRHIFVARLGRFYYSFIHSKICDIPYEEWLETDNSKGEKFRLLHISQPDIAELMYKEQMFLHRRNLFKIFQNKMSSVKTVDEMFDVYKERQDLFIC